MAVDDAGREAGPVEENLRLDECPVGLLFVLAGEVGPVHGIGTQVGLRRCCKTGP
jgi:hypothetical protein